MVKLTKSYIPTKVLADITETERECMERLNYIKAT